MPAATMRFAVAALAVSAGASGALAAPASSPWGEKYWPNVPLVTHDGREVRFYDDLVKDRHVVVSFIYTRCNKQCGPITANLARAKRVIGERVGKNLHFYSITMDPERDTPEVLARYAKAFKAGEGWTFLTGKKEDVELLRKKFGDLNPVENHSAHVHIGNDTIGQWMSTSGLDNPQFLANVIANWLDPAWAGRAPDKSYVNAPDIPRPTLGQALYAARCAACHMPGGTSVGPDLAGVVGRRDREWLARWIKSPEKLVAERDPAAIELVAKHDDVLMPNMDLTDGDVAAVIEYLEKRSQSRK